MPSKKKPTTRYVKPKRSAYKLLLRLTQFELALLRYIAEKTERRLVTVFRDALRSHVRHHMRFDADDFRSFLKRESLAQDAEEGTTAFMREVELFLGTVPDELPKAAQKPVDRFLADSTSIKFNGARDFGK